MIKKFLMLSMIVGYLSAGLINALSIVVNEEVITLYDIDKAMQQQNLSENQAISMLIDKILYKQEIKKFDITLEDKELKEYIKKLAQTNKMSLEKFKSAVKQNQDYKLFIAETKKRLLNQKLISKIALGKLKIANDEDIKMYYDNNIKQFRVSKNSIEVIPLEKIKNKIFNAIMGEREQNYLKEYFETLKITANIKIIR